MTKNYTIKDIIDKVKKNKRWPDTKLIQRAYNYAVLKHGDQKRKSGEPYIIHPTNVAYTIAELGLDEHTICAALLHDVVEDTDVTDEDWNKIINTNLYSAFCVTQEVLPNMIHNKKGCIINISSVWGIVGASCETIYSIAKAGMDGMTKSLAKELGPSNIRVNSIAPGIIDTDMNKKLTSNDIENIEEEIPLGKIGKTIDIARCVKWILEDEYTTGQIISVNGGWVI
mgnify:CR=1 FL=1